MTQHKKRLLVVSEVSKRFKDNNLKLSKEYLITLEDQLQKWISTDINNLLLNKQKEIEGKLNGN
jgi:hypothetical protein